MPRCQSITPKDDRLSSSTSDDFMFSNYLLSKTEVTILEFQSHLYFKYNLISHKIPFLAFNISHIYTLIHEKVE